MSNFTRMKHNPKEMINYFWPNASVDHITYVPELKDSDRDYWVRRQCGHDGTLLFTHEMLQKALIELVNKQTFCASNPPDFNKIKDIKYTIGPMKHSSVFGQVLLGCSETQTYPGMKERVRMVVKVEYIY